MRIRTSSGRRGPGPDHEDPRRGRVFGDPRAHPAHRLPHEDGLAVERIGWRHVDLLRGVLRLEPGETKNGDGRTAFLPPDLVEALRLHRAKVERLQVRLGRVIPEVFVRLGGKLAGRPLGSFRKRWDSACAAASVPGLLIHDLRRSGIRNMVRAGISEHTAMKISGHKTRSVFDRYDIISEDDLRAAAGRIAMGTIAGTIAPAAVESLR